MHIFFKKGIFGYVIWKSRDTSRGEIPLLFGCEDTSFYINVRSDYCSNWFIIELCFFLVLTMVCLEDDRSEFFFSFNECIKADNSKNIYSNYSRIFGGVVRKTNKLVDKYCPSELSCIMLSEIILHVWTKVNTFEPKKNRKYLILYYFIKHYIYWLGRCKYV